MKTKKKNTKKGKVIFVIPSLRKGGAERVVSLLSIELEKQGYIVKIALFDNEIEYKYGGEIIDLKTPSTSNYLIKPLRFFQRILKLRKVFKKEKPDYIFSFMEGCNFASILTGEKVVVSVRNNPEVKYNSFYKFLIKILYRLPNVRKVIAVSKGIEQILNKQFAISNTKTIYNPVVIKKDYVIKEDLTKYKPFILAVGRLHKQKNFELLINAYAKSKLKNKVNIVIIGEGEERDKLQNLIEKYKLANRIFLVGKKDNIEDYYLQSEIFVLSSRYEGFPNVLIEALAHNCACIATDCPTGPNEIIKNYENGILISNENEKELIKALETLYFDVKLRNKLKQNAQKSVEHLKVENIVNEWMEID